MNRRWIFVLAAVVLFIGSFPDFGQGAQAKEEILKIAIAGEMSSLDPMLYYSSADTVLVKNWGEFMLNKAPSGEVTPGVVESWKMAPDGKKMECTLRKGVKFHSGDFLTTKDVEFSYKRGIEKNSSIKSAMRSVQRLEIIDDYHFNFYFKEPDVLFIPRASGFYIGSKSYYDRVGEDVFTRQPSGTGPYKVVLYRPGEYIDIERFEEYWGTKPTVKRARIYFIAEETTRIAKLKTGEVDLIAGVPYTEVKELEKSPTFRTIKLETNQPLAGVDFGTNNPKVPWYDKRVRFAMAHAIDAKSIIRNVLMDVPVHNAALAPNELGYDPELKPYAYDPKKAKALLAEAGYPNGFDLKLHYSTGSRVGMGDQVVQAIAAYLEAIGIRTKLIALEHEVLSQMARTTGLDPKGEYVAYHSACFGGSVDPVNNLGGYFTKDGARPIYDNPVSTKIIHEARATMDDKKRGELIKKAVNFLHEEVIVIPIFTNVAVYAMKKNIDFNPTKKEGVDLVLVKDVVFK